jgi:hypothetical protein
MPRKAAARLEVVVTVGDSHTATIDDVADRLREKGLSVSHVMRSLGTIAGTATAASVERCKRLPGINAVEVMGTVQIAPPTSSIQ